jgi:hypothetical protein
MASSRQNKGSPSSQKSAGADEHSPRKGLAPDLSDPAWQGIGGIGTWVGVLIALVALLATVIGLWLPTRSTNSAPTAPSEEAGASVASTPSSVRKYAGIGRPNLTLRTHSLPAFPLPVNPGRHGDSAAQLTINISAYSKAGDAILPGLEIRCVATPDQENVGLDSWRVTSGNATVQCSATNRDCLVRLSHEIPSGSVYSVTLDIPVNSVRMTTEDDAAITVESRLDLAQVGEYSGTAILTDTTVLRVLGPVEGILRIEVYSDENLSTTITQGDPLYTASVLEIGLSDGSSLLTAAQDGQAVGIAEKLVQPGRTYTVERINGLASGYRDVSAECANVKEEFGRCIAASVVPSGGQATLLLLVQPVP